MRGADKFGIHVMAPCSVNPCLCSQYFSLRTHDVAVVHFEQFPVCVKADDHSAR